MKSAPISPPPPEMVFGRAIVADLDAGLRREWLVTNGLGGFAGGTVAGVPTRRYHGWLVAATEPPVGRRVLVGGLLEQATIGGTTVDLHDFEFADGTIGGGGYVHAQSFALDGSLPTWTYAIDDALVERRTWMAHRSNTTYVRYRHVRGSLPLDLEVGCLVTDRDFHELRRAGAGDPGPLVSPIEDGVLVRWTETGTPLRIVARDATFDPAGGWWWGFRHREEAARGLDDLADLYLAGRHRVRLAPGASWTLVLSTEAAPEADGEAALDAAKVRDSDLIHRAGAERSSAFVRQLVLAADRFIVARAIPGGTGEPAEPGAPAVEGRSVIAGYPWFNDWGRDTMIALPGLTLATGRPEIGASILRAFGHRVADGLLPNDFPSTPDERPEYNTVDAGLWYIQALRAHTEATADKGLVDELLPVVRGIVDAYISGTRYGIGVDGRDGLLRAGEPGMQLTWMDARYDGRVVTPRIGKPVEINALWYNALCTVGPWLLDRGETAVGTSCMALAEQVVKSFRERFWRPELGHLADVVDGPDGDDLTLRPNQVFALSLPFPLLERTAARSTLEAVGRSLLTSYGVRTLAPSDPAYAGRYEGDRAERDTTYHQGPAWAWLSGAYAEAVDRVAADRATALSILRPFEAHLADAGLGSISELFDGDAPHLPRGCPFQAWSVAEVLRVWRSLAGE